MNEYNLSTDNATEHRTSTGWLLKWNLGSKWVKSCGFIGDFCIWDSFAEIIASTVAKDLGIQRCLEYRPCIINIENKIKVLGCESDNFKPQGYTELTLYKLMELGYIDRGYAGYEGYYKLIKDAKKALNINIQGLLEDIIILDAIILNSDRNFWNISLLSNRINTIEAPIYDSGSSLGLTSYNSGEFDRYNMYINIPGCKSHPFSDTFEEQVKFVRKNREYRKRLNKTAELIKYLRANFNKNSNRYNIQNCLDDGQLNYIVDLLRSRMKEILG